MVFFYILQKGDLLLSVDGTNLCGLTHSQAVATLKATINLDQVALGIMDGPETSFGASNFVPSWMYWQKLPRSLQYPKTGKSQFCSRAEKRSISKKNKCVENFFRNGNYTLS